MNLFCRFIDLPSEGLASYGIAGLIETHATTGLSVERKLTHLLAVADHYTLRHASKYTQPDNLDF